VSQPDEPVALAPMSKSPVPAFGRAASLAQRKPALNAAWGRAARLGVDKRDLEKR
jgi:hypothetical protein